MAAVLVAARASDGDSPESAIASSLRPVQLSWRSDECKHRPRFRMQNL